MGAGVSKTVTHRPAARPEAAGPPASRCVVDLAKFQRSIVEIGLIDAEELARFVVAPDQVSRLAGALIRAGRLTAYQAAALAQGKTKGLLIGDYLVLDKLGQGGMGVVFKARHRPTGHVVAMKVLPPSFGRDRAAVQRFRREVEIASRLDHPNLVAALDASEVQGVYFLTMEYISGYDLERLAADGGPLPIDLALHCTIHAARGLAAAHAQGIIHRDVKPANVMLDEMGSVRVLDLGLARVVEAGNLIGGSPVGSLTQSGAYMGTVDFMAPEQADDPRNVDHRADIYSLGCTLYFLLTGRPPFLADTVLKRLMAHQERPAPTLQAARPEASEKLEAAYLQMMAKLPAERPDSMADVIDHLEACRTSPDNEDEARSGLTAFAKRAFKRAVPRGRDRGPDASIFARRPKTEGLQWDPDVRFEDVVMDLRDEERPGPLTEERLPPIVSRQIPKRVRRRRSSVPYGLIGLALIGMAIVAYVLLPRSKPIIQEAATTAPKSLPPTTEAPATPRTGSVLYVDEFNDRTSGWDEEPAEQRFKKGDEYHGYVDGLYCIDAYTGPAWWFWRFPKGAFSEFTCNVVARVYGDKPDSFGKLLIGIGLEGPNGLQVGLHADGRIFVLRRDRSAEGWKNLGVRRHSAIKTGPNDFNKFVLNVRKRRVEIFINGVQVYDPVNLDWDVTPANLSLGIDCKVPNIRAEFDRIEIRELASSPATSAGDSPLETREPATKPGTLERPRVLYVDEFNDPNSGWPRDDKTDHRHGYSDGVYYIETDAGAFYCWRPEDRPVLDAGNSLHVVARVLGQGSGTPGSWYVMCETKDPRESRQGKPRGFQVNINRNGELFLAPLAYSADFYPEDPRIGPIVHAAIRPGNQYNALEIRSKKRQVEILVNNVQICAPVTFDWEVTPTRILLGSGDSDHRTRSEFQRIEVRKLDAPARLQER
ncbi:MAG: serine/threonine protein kinase [Isosphaeraceae bacterium]